MSEHIYEDSDMEHERYHIIPFGSMREEIVRCRDCKFCDNDVFAYWCCREKCREFEVDSLDGKRMGFCAWGERRDI